MKAHAMAFAFVVLTLVTSTAHADNDEEETSEPKPPARQQKLFVEPTGGWVAGRWMGVPVAKVTGGVDALFAPAPTKVPIAIDMTFFAASGSTENGLDVKRIEIGAGISSLPRVVRLMGGGHLSYAWMTRKTMPGSIGGFGIGVHACAEAAIPLGEMVALTIGLRASVDLYDGGLGYEGGPFAGLRF